MRGRGRGLQAVRLVHGGGNRWKGSCGGFCTETERKTGGSARGCRVEKRMEEGGGLVRAVPHGGRRRTGPGVPAAARERWRGVLVGRCPAPCGSRGAGGRTELGRARENSAVLKLTKNFQTDKIWFDQNWLYLDKKISNKLWICRELNKEQVSLSRFSKFGLEFELKIKESSRCWIQMKIWSNWIEALRLDEIWTRRSRLHLDNTSTPEREF
jgi:hypothetical protein